MAEFNETLFKDMIAPEYKSISISKLQIFIDEAELEVSLKYWGKYHPRAWGLMTAHLRKMFDISKNKEADEGNNQIKKSKVGDLETEYAVSDAKGQDTLSLTIYGKEYTRLRKKRLAGPIFISC